MTSLRHLARPAHQTRWPVASITLGAIAALLLAVPGAASALEFRGGSGGATGDAWWRWLTGHWTHFGASHGLWDIAVFVGLGAVIEMRSRAHFALATAFSALAIAAAVRWGAPELTHYRGLSGIDSALFGWLAIDALLRGSRTMRILAALCVAGFGGKLAYELCTQSTLFVDATTEWAPVPLAHLVGGAVGGLVGIRAPGATEPTRRATCSSCGPA